MSSPPPYDPTTTPPGEVVASLFPPATEFLESPYTEYQVQTTYENDEGILQMPVAGPDPTPAVIIRTHAPCTRKIVRWVAERQGGMPTLPDPEPPTTTQFLKRSLIARASKKLNADGITHRWRVEGMFEYV